jgi:hypothetical protein
MAVLTSSGETPARTPWGERVGTDLGNFATSTSHARPVFSPIRSRQPTSGGRSQRRYRGGQQPPRP